MKTLKKIISLVLCLAMVASYIPLTARAEVRNASVQAADPSTMDSWQEQFLQDVLSTENAGSVWTDKSVFSDASAFLGTGITMTAQDSFLVALSAMGSNMAVTGMSHMPTDTMLVLDVSGSMNDNDGNNNVAEELVEAANESIRTLLETNAHNRVGVVLYSGPTSVGGAASANDAVLVLPLGRYTATDGNYLHYNVETVTTGSGRNQQTSTTESVSLDPNVVYEGTTQKPTSVNKVVEGGTYIQKGLHLAMGQFTADSNSTTVADPILGTMARKPILVLMSDGSPTVASSNFTAPSSINLGDGSYTDAAIGFVSQLTAAYVKAQIEAKYGTESLFFTLGLGTSNDDIATSVLNPVQSSTAVNDFWKAYQSAAVNGTVTVKNSGRTTIKVTKISTQLRKEYVSQYFAVTEQGGTLAAGLKQAFQDIVGAIQLQSQYFPTLVDVNEDLSGYVSFVDKIGQYMDVVSIRGILINNVLYSGAELAKNFAPGFNGGALGTTAAPTTLGNEMVSAVQARLGLSSADEARTLISLAYENGQLRYTSDSDFSNYIGWYANAAGQFLGHWHEGITTMPETTGNPDTNPAYIIRSYGYLGAVDKSLGVAESDMMYATVQVRTSIATGEVVVAFAVPAALLPVVTYQVSLNEDGTLRALETSGATQPIRLVYEVALQKNINSFTLKDLIPEAYLSANTDANGNVSFYTNQYEADGTAGYGKANTYSYFHPSRQNDRYYYLTNTAVYADDRGTLYTGEQSPSGTMYRAYQVYVKDGSTLKTEIRYRQIAPETLENAMQYADGTWYIPAGNVFVNLEGYTAPKTENTTGTLSYSYLPYVDAHDHNVGDTGYSFVVGATLGNNGKLLVTPSTGIALSKVMAPDATPPTSAFRFLLTNTTNESDSGTYPVMVTHADGTTSITAVTFENGRATVALNAGEKLYIGGMIPGTVYTVEEEATVEYIPQQATATVTIVAGELKRVEFINADRGTGNLTVTKQVIHNLGADYVLPADRSFSIRVKLTGIGTANTTFAVSHSGNTFSTITTDDAGEFTLVLSHMEQVTILGLPTGTVATITEDAPGNGFTAGYREGDLSGDGTVTIGDGTTHSVTVENTYAPTRVSPVNVALVGSKVYHAPQWNGAEFTFLLQKWNGSSWQTIATDTATEGKTSFDFQNALAGEVFTAPGAYYYQVSEVNGGQTISGITYDATLHTFGILVADADMDGQLEIEKVISYHTGKEFSKNAAGNWDVQITFTNAYHAADSTLVLDVKKELTNLSGSPLVSKAGFRFGLYEGESLVATSELTDGVGEARFLLTYSQADVGVHSYTLQEIVPTDKIPGMQYSQETYTVEITVTDNGDGTTSAKVTAINGSENFTTPVFTNVYDPGAAALPIDFVSKELTGRQQKAGEFRFAVLDANGTPVLNGTNDGNGKVTFDGQLYFSRVGSYTYTILEIGTDSKGLTMDKTRYVVHITVTDQGGRLTATYSVMNVAGDTIVFRNSYKASETTYTFTGIKTLAGRFLLNDEFTFLLAQADANGNVTPGGMNLEAKNFTDGTFRFPAISYGEAGTYHYVVSEKADSIANYGILYDSTRYFVTLTVTDNLEGQLEVSDVTIRTAAGNAVDAISFHNVYQPAPVQVAIPGSKALTGKVLGAGNFRFELYAADAAWQQGSKLETIANAEDGGFLFTALPAFTEVGTWYYLVKEVYGGQTIDGITYDDTVYRIAIEVTDDLVGNLHATIHVFDSNDIPQMGILFVNSYAVSGSASVTLHGTKELLGAALADGAFAFDLFKTDATFAATGAALQSATNANGAFSFQLNYTAADIGTHYYVVNERNGGKTLDGITYSSAAYYITVVVSDNGKGGISAAATISDGEKAVEKMQFVNTYGVSGSASVTLHGTKELLGAALADGAFAFDLFKTDATFAATGVALQSATNANGAFSFQLSYTVADIGTHYYVVNERNGGKVLDGITYSSAAYYITVVVSDNGKGGISAAATISDGDKAVEKMQFVNTYGVSGSASVTLHGTKELLGAALADGAFTFDLYKTDATFAATGAALQSATNANGAFSFQLSYTAADIGTHYYVVNERNGGQTLDGVTYSSAAYYITVVVSDNGKGGISAAATISDGDKAVEKMQFVNRYAITETLTISLEGTKILKGKVLSANEFSFLLYAADSEFRIESGALQTVTNGADGTIRFGGIPVTAPGTYHFVVAESTAAEMDNVTFDQSRYHITALVEDNGKGGLRLRQLEIRKVQEQNEEPVDSITFVNTYTPDPDAMSLEFEVNKTVTNLGSEVIGPEGFLFQLENMTIGGILSALSDADGKALFPLTYTKEDIGKTYTYKLSEVNDGRDNVTYSDVAYNITVTITLNENNELVATITNNGAAVEKVIAEFENIYNYTPEPDPTGDPGLMLWTATMAVSALGGMITTKCFRKKQD